MMAFFKMNTSDYILQQRGVFHEIGSFPISKMIFAPIFEWFSFNDGFLMFTERAAWWFHFIGILFFMNYLYYSKHLHIILAFPNTWFANLQPKGKFNNLDSVTKEIKLMTVSYTHLDVYKRQTWHWDKEKWEKDRLRDFSTSWSM